MILAHLANHIRSMLLIYFPLRVTIFDCTGVEIMLVVLVMGVTALALYPLSWPSL